ncbi:recombination regulator RecX [Methyloversatilis thermotolerans]|uniref:recombination regulator RecX n=1 Tax=Methyloversatilis thermotolerans TaxID=1346290 RepID=UPI00037C2A17|nr:recombination regulator RecX [Methyloversatilis thermotolerans]
MSDALREKALRLLARRDHSRAELVRKLREDGSAEDVAALLARLEEGGLLSDARFAKQFVSSRATRFGARRLAHDLRQRGISDSDATDAMASMELDETARARAVWARRFDCAPQDAKTWAKQARFLQSRGFSTDTIRKVLREQPEQEHE